MTEFEELINEADKKYPHERLYRLLKRKAWMEHLKKILPHIYNKRMLDLKQLFDHPETSRVWPRLCPKEYDWFDCD